LGDDAGRLAYGTIRLPTRRRRTSEDGVQRNIHSTEPVETHLAREADGVSRADTRPCRTTHEKEVHIPSDLPSHVLFLPRVSSASPVLVATIEICLV
jgi:hypothetical protein